MKPKKPFALVVDDDPIQRTILHSVLTKLGITNETVATSKEFIEKLNKTKPDFCLIDLNLESLGAGFTLIQAIRNVLGYEPILIVISGNTEKKAIAHALEIGANDYILKPFDRDVLISKISYYTTTEELQNEQLPLLPVPEGGSPATFNLEFNIQEVDEFGITLNGKHLILKGLALNLESQLLQEITGLSKPPLFTVTSTWIEANGTYSAYAEFDTTNDKLRASVQQWLAINKN